MWVVNYEYLQCLVVMVNFAATEVAGSNQLRWFDALWSERGWKKSRFGKKGSLRVTTGGKLSMG